METVIWSKTEQERAGTPLLVMLHGYGTDESRMSKLFDSLPPEFTCATGNQGNSTIHFHEATLRLMEDAVSPSLGA